MADISNLAMDASFLPIQMPKQKEGLSLAKKPVGDLRAKPNDKAAELRKAAEQFEAIFLNQMMKEMRNSIEKEDMFHGGTGEDIFSEMLDEEFSKRMAGRGSVGIADMLFNQLSRQYGIGDEQDASQNPAMPGISGAANTLQQKLRSAQDQVHSQDPQHLKTDF